MSQFEFKCPLCGESIEADDSFCGQVAECPFCGKEIVVPRGTTRLGSAGNGDARASTERPISFGKKSFRPIPPSKEEVAIPERFARPAQDDMVSPEATRAKGWTGRAVNVLLAVIGIVVIAGVASYGGYLYFGDMPRLERGIAYYEKKAYTEAMQLLLPLAEKGCAKAQLYVGDCHANGRGVILDTTEAVKWYRTAADQEVAEAQHRMFVCCRDGIGTERNQKNAAKWCRKAADAGFDEAMFDMGMLYLKGEGVESNAKSAFRWFRKGAERGYPPALYQFGLCYKLGVGAEKDEDEAAKWQNKAVSAWRASANAGESHAMILLGLLYQEGDVVETDKEEAVKWYRRASERGDALAQFLLAACYIKGMGVDEDMEEAARWMLKSAEQGSLRQSQLLKRRGCRELVDGGELGSLAGGAQFAMGLFCREGKGVEKNPAEAVKWFERSAKRGCKEAKFHLAMCYMKGEGVQQDTEKAEQLLEEAADAGDGDARKELQRIKDEREEKARRLAQEKSEKKNKIKELSDIENEITERKERINGILKGRLKGDWLGFDADKIAETDTSVSVVEEQSWKSVADGLSVDDATEKIDRALASARKEAERLEGRQKELVRVKGAYDEKDLESRKEKCVPCGGGGRVECARCKGRGVAIVAGNDCPACKGKGSISKPRPCDACGGRGTVKRRCQKCQGKGKFKCASCRGRGYVDVTGRLNRPTCDSCAGRGYKTCALCSGRGYQMYNGNAASGNAFGASAMNWFSCEKCSGTGKLGEVTTRCSRCNGTGKEQNEQTCPSCDGKGKAVCDHCRGKGFTYRPKNGLGQNSFEVPESDEKIEVQHGNPQKEADSKPAQDEMSRSNRTPIRGRRGRRLRAVETGDQAFGAGTSSSP